MITNMVSHGKENVTRLLVSIFIVWLSSSAITCYYPFMVITSTNITSSPVLMYINNFSADIYGEPAVGDPIKIRVNVTSIMNHTQKVRMKIIVYADNITLDVIERTVSLGSYETKCFTFDKLLKTGGKIYFRLICYINDDEAARDEFVLWVRSYKKRTDFVVTYFHFNVQFYLGKSEIRDRIINQSIRELLVFYVENPEYKFSFEIQSYGLEVMADKFPDVLDSLKKLVRRGQMELIVTHYSDQYFIAYPESDLKKSIKISDDILKSIHLRRSNVFGCQEWQYSPALLDIMNDNGYTIYVGREQNFKHFGVFENITQSKTPILKTKWNGDSTNVIFNYDVDIDGDREIDSLRYTWAWSGDGSAVNTNTYSNDFKFKPDKQRAFEKLLYKYKSEDREFVTISELVYAIKEKDLDIKEIETIPCSVQANEYLWAGEKSAEYEQDVEINTLRYKARSMLLALEDCIDYARDRGKHVNDQEGELQELWKRLMLAECTDATGWYPKIEEVNYGLNESQYIIKRTEILIDEILDILDYNDVPVIVDTDDNDVKEFNDKQVKENCTFPLPFNVTYDNYSFEAYNISNSIYVLDITVEVINDSINICFPVLSNEAAYTPMSCGTFLELHPYADIVPYIMLSNGLIYLGNDTSIICINSVRYPVMRYDGSKVYFKETEVNGTIDYRFICYLGNKDDAIDIARRYNDSPIMVFNHAE